MKTHFPVINKRGATTASIIMAIGIIIFSISLSKKLNSDSFFWMIPLVLGIIIFLMCMMVLMSVLTAGIDVVRTNVVFSDVSGQGGKKPQFDLSELSDIELHNADGIIETPESANLVGGRIIFKLKDGSTRMYYPIQITYKQYKNIHDGILQMSKEVQSRK